MDRSGGKSRRLMKCCRKKRDLFMNDVKAFRLRAQASARRIRASPSRRPPSAFRTEEGKATKKDPFSEQENGSVMHSGS